MVDGPHPKSIPQTSFRYPIRSGIAERDSAGSRASGKAGSLDMLESWFHGLDVGFDGAITESG